MFGSLAYTVGRHNAGDRFFDDVLSNLHFGETLQTISWCIKMTTYIITHPSTQYKRILDHSDGDLCALEQAQENIARGGCESLNLVWLFDFVREQNPSNNLPYHNWFHTCCVVAECIEAGQYYNLPFVSYKQLVAAAIMHDYRHSGGKKSDRDNVDEACRHANIQLKGRGFSDEFTQPVVATILATEYPFTTKPFSIEQKIIRDADLMMITHDNWFLTTVDMLKQEIGVSENREIPLLEAVFKQRSFIHAAVLYTDWGREKYDKFRKHRFDQLTTIIEEGTKSPLS